MRFRSDFVTNSSSSSFILATKGTLNKKQEEALLRYIVRKFVNGNMLSKEDLNTDEIYDEHALNKAIEASNKGMSIVRGDVVFDESEWNLCNIYQEIWNILEENSDGNFEVIDGSLDY